MKTYGNRPGRAVPVDPYEGDEDRPEMVFITEFQADSTLGTTAAALGLCADPDAGKFDVAIFLDPTIAHWLDPVPAKSGEIAYRMEGPTREGYHEEVTITRLADGRTYCTCWKNTGCEHIHALEALGMFSPSRTP